VNEIVDELCEASALVFAAPEYWEGVHGKARAFWERVCFSLRHNDNFPLSGMPGVAIGVSGDGTAKKVLTDIADFFADARIELVEETEIQGEYACFTCGYGDRCEVGGLAEIYDLPLDLGSEHIPDLECQHPERGAGVNIRQKLTAIGEKLARKS
jgi:multimeric flavodoxin WrbA